MEKEAKVVLYVFAAVVGGVLLYKAYKKANPTTANQAYQQLLTYERPSVSAGFTNKLGTPKATLTYETPTSNTTYFFEEGDWDKLNLAQKILLKLGVSPKAVLE